MNPRFARNVEALWLSELLVKGVMPGKNSSVALAAIPDHPATPVNTRCCKMAFVNIFEKSSA
jgi:hypothetical protein